VSVLPAFLERRAWPRPTFGQAKTTLEELGTRRSYVRGGGAAGLLRPLSGALARPGQERGHRPTFRTVTTSRVPSARRISMELVKPSGSSTTHTSCGA
jgi:hypothetical protein